MAIQLTERAAQEVKTIMEQQKFPGDTALRVGVRGGGCSGFNYVLDLVEKPAVDDEVLDCHGVRLVCDPKSLLYLDGTTIDFRDEMMGRGFVFNNPNATSTCGCGNSFTA